MKRPSATEIQAFCGGCDRLKNDGDCKIDAKELSPHFKTSGGLTDQQRYVARDWCGWAIVNGEKMERDSDGFQKR